MLRSWSAPEGREVAPGTAGTLGDECAHHRPVLGDFGFAVLAPVIDGVVDVRARLGAFGAEGLIDAPGEYQEAVPRELVIDLIVVARAEVAVPVSDDGLVPEA